MKTYFFKNSINNLIKIGKSTNVMQRAKQVSGQCPFIEISVLYVVDGNYESYFHSLYKEFRKDGEWFDIPGLSVSKIENDLNRCVSKETETEETFSSRCCQSVHYFTFLFTLKILYGVIGKSIISELDKIKGAIDFISVRQGFTELIITENYHRDNNLKKSTKNEMDILVSVGERQVRFFIKEI